MGLTMMERSESINELAKALALAQLQMTPAKRDATNPFFKSDYATLESVSDACLPALNKNGIAVTQTTAPGNDFDHLLYTTLMHTSGQWITSCYIVHPTKNDPQASGSALSYARRYSLAAIAGVVVSDDDGEGAMERGGQGKDPKEGGRGPIPLVKPTGNTASYDRRHNEKQEALVTEKQVVRLWTIARGSFWAEADVKAYLESIGLTSTRELNRLEYDKLIATMESFPKEKPEGNEAHGG